MIGKLIGAFAGNQIAKSTRGGVGGPAGAALGFAAPMILRRISLPTLALLGAGGYFAKKFFDEKDGSTGTGTRHGHGIVCHDHERAGHLRTTGHRHGNPRRELTVSLGLTEWGRGRTVCRAPFSYPIAACRP